MDKSTRDKANSLQEKLAQMAANRGGVGPSHPPAPTVQTRAPSTMPGMVFGAQTALRDAQEKAAVLEQKLAQFDGARPVRLLDARLVRASRWANRDESSFSDAEFGALKAEIASSGGNVQPIKVRPISVSKAQNEGGVGPSHSPSPGAEFSPQFEIVFGHRRHRACLDLAVPVLALVDESLSDSDLFAQMERENRERKDLTPWEQGRMYAHALDEGLFQSATKLADAIGRDTSDVGKALNLARLPQEIIDAIGDRQALQFRWSKPLKDALQADPEGVLGKARAIIAAGQPSDPKAVFEALIQPEGRGVGPSNPPRKSKPRTADLGHGAKIKFSDYRSFQLDLGKKKLTDDQAQQLFSTLKELLSKF